jgi:UDP-N-acetylglucosamine 2-epimerase (non-hydrolysing)
MNETVKKDKLILFTIHRRENLGKPVQELIYAINMLSKVFKEYNFFVVTHANPEVAKPLIEGLKGLNNVVVSSPLSYTKFVYLMARARFVVTDSGGVSQEAPSFSTPVLMIRNVCENPELLESNVAKLIGTNWSDIYDNCKKLINDEQFYNSMLGKNPYGDGKSYEKITKKITEVLK